MRTGKRELKHAPTREITSAGQEPSGARAFRIQVSMHTVCAVVLVSNMLKISAPADLCIHSNASTFQHPAMRCTSTISSHCPIQVLMFMVRMYVLFSKANTITIRGQVYHTIPKCASWLFPNSPIHLQPNAVERHATAIHTLEHHGATVTVVKLPYIISAPVLNNIVSDRNHIVL